MSTAVDIDSSPDEAEPPASPPHRRDVGRTLVRGVGQTLVTFGLVALLFVVYELWVTDLIAAQDQRALSDQIHQEWADAPTVTAPDGSTPDTGTPLPPITVEVGDPFAVLHIPRLGSDYSRVVVEGVSQKELAQGPGHYGGTAMPGELGNFAMAGHRVGRGSPFLDLDTLRPGDPIIVETGTHWFVYRVLGDPATGSFDGDPSGIPGQEIVTPDQVQVIAPTPDSTAPPTDAYLTLTTCHPKFSARQRMVIHARLDGAPLSKTDAPDGPPELNG